MAAAYKSNWTFQTTKTNASLRPQKKTVKTETSEEMVGDRNMPLGLLLEKKKLMIFKNVLWFLHFAWNIVN